MALLDPEDLAYMRATQAEARPTQALFRRRTFTRTATGGRTATLTAGTTVMVRIDATPDEQPQTLAARAEGGTLAKIVTELGLDVHDQDEFHITTTPPGGNPITTVYQVVTDGEQDTWATAQVVWARRMNRPVEA